MKAPKQSCSIPQSKNTQWSVHGQYWPDKIISVTCSPSALSPSGGGSSQLPRTLLYPLVSPHLSRHGPVHKENAYAADVQQSQSILGTHKAYYKYTVKAFSVSPELSSVRREEGCWLAAATRRGKEKKKRKRKAGMTRMHYTCNRTFTQ